MGELPETTVDCRYGFDPALAKQMGGGGGGRESCGAETSVSSNRRLKCVRANQRRSPKDVEPSVRGARPLF
jgi:hypothetical protein